MRGLTAKTKAAFCAALLFVACAASAEPAFILGRGKESIVLTANGALSDWGHSPGSLISSASSAGEIHYGTNVLELENPSAVLKKDGELVFTRALLAEFGSEVDALNWDETFHISPGDSGSDTYPGYADRAMMRLVRDFQAPVSLSNGWGNDTGFSEMTAEQRQRALELFKWRKQFKTKLQWFEQLPQF